jgi:hypothetical protein
MPEATRVGIWTYFTKDCEATTPFLSLEEYEDNELATPRRPPPLPQGSTTLRDIDGITGS